MTITLRSFFLPIGFAVVVLCPWGSLDYFDAPVRTIFLICGIIATYLLGGLKRRSRRGKEYGESNWLFIVLLISTLVIGFAIPFLSARSITAIALPAYWQYAGILLFLTGIWIRKIAIKTLKKQFSIFVAIQEDHQLITTGIYSRIRHPIYLAAAITLTGYSLVFPSWTGFLFVLFYLILLSHRIRNEESLMQKHFGSVYEEYKSNSYRLIPHIY